MATDSKQNESYRNRWLFFGTLFPGIAAFAAVKFDAPPTYWFGIVGGLLFSLGSIFLFRESSGRRILLVLAILQLLFAIAAVLISGMMLLFGRIPF